MARTPDKLRRFLTEQHNVPPKAIDQYLTIHQGDAKDPAAVAKALLSPTKKNTLVDIILSGLGAYPTFQWSITLPFPLTDPTVCEDATAALYTSISNLSSSSITSTRTGTNPLLVVVSTAGARTKGRGVPLSIYWLYEWLLGSPLADKRRMESLILADRGAHVRDFVLIRPPFLTDGEALGRESIKVGWEWGLEEVVKERVKEPGPRIGWTISRKDLGAWTFENVVQEGGWEGRCVTMSY